MRTGLFTLAAFAQLALLVTADVEPYKIPLYRRSSGDGIVTASGKALDNGVVKLKPQRNESSTISNESSSTIARRYDPNWDPPSSIHGGFRYL